MTHDEEVKLYKFIETLEHSTLIHKDFPMAKPACDECKTMAWCPPGCSNFHKSQIELQKAIRQVNFHYTPNFTPNFTEEPKMAKEAARFNEGKPRLSYFRRSFQKMVEGIAWVKTFGANKYEEDNWRSGGKPDTEYHDSMDRHLALFAGGEVYDQDSGCHHLAHACWNLCALLELNYPDVPMRDVEIYEERMRYWAAVKEEKQLYAEAQGNKDITNATGLCEEVRRTGASLIPKPKVLKTRVADHDREVRVTEKSGWHVYTNAKRAALYYPPGETEILGACRNKDNGNDNYMGEYKYQFEDEVTE